MPTIHYDLIGTHPKVEDLRDTMHVVISSFLRGLKIDEKVIIEAAEHFYGLRLEDFDDVRQLAEAVMGLDQELEFA